ncbi:YhcN/YlaJ family sporulation lipoprotein [Peribacillus sp. NPDC006672]|uniref:YhcN/YlaJ family sporulation lipoprotein n=1 Tax=Peribacillus sp. NPDC006672 TaxID=3390606 RepID=UPI003CFFE717
MPYKLNCFIPFFSIIIVLLMTGCSANSSQTDSNKDRDLNISKVHTSNPIDQTAANQAKDKLMNQDEVADVKAVNSNKELLVAIKVENFDRLRLKKIEKKSQTELEDMFPDYKILVSTDQKMFIELEQLEQELEKDHTKMDSLNRDFKRIKALLNEKT